MGFLQKLGIYQQSKGHATLFIAYLAEAINIFTSLRVQIPPNTVRFAYICIWEEIFVKDSKSSISA